MLDRLLELTHYKNIVIKHQIRIWPPKIMNNQSSLIRIEYPDIMMKYSLD